MASRRQPKRQRPKPYWGWESNLAPDGYHHIMPLGDTFPHSSTHPCWCNPFEDDDEDVDFLVHRAHDGREDFEEERRKPS